ncbi:hypothetical protein [Metapseudomonas otitidis]|uniref:hypothetical protein n=1 Tax=Metapseudomonas otitidis TaxID=319939 RepID=UPI0013F59D79|nr:hypothetical protein [Pseudomonas otitidis]
MAEGIRRSQRDYTQVFKLAVVDQVEKGEMSYNEAQARYGSAHAVYSIAKR